MGDPGGGIKSIAPLTNVGLMASLVERVMGRAEGLPGLGTFHGFSGYGKSIAATYAMNRYRCVLVQIKSCWTRKYLCNRIATELELKPAKTIPEMVEQIGEELAASGRVLILDEADHLCTRPLIELVRDIYESAGAGIVLIGEEHLPAKLQAWERVHNRVLDWVAAQPATLSDAQMLARLYCPSVTVADDLLSMLHEASHGNCRRVCVNLNRLAEHAAAEALDAIIISDLPTDWAWFTGTPPKRRV